MTEFIDAHIPIDAERGEPLMNSAFHYLAHVAWPHRTEYENKQRKRLVGALLAAQYKSRYKVRGRDIPAAKLTEIRGIKRKEIAAAINKGLERIYTRRIPAFRMLVHRWMVAGLIDPPPWLTSEQRTHLLALGATRTLVQPEGDLLGRGRILLTDRAESDLDNIDRDIWRDSKPALAMLCGLWPLRVFGSGKHVTVTDGMGEKSCALVGRISSLLDSDPSWVTEAVADARMMALYIEHTINPRKLLVPRRVLLRGNVDTLHVNSGHLVRLFIPSTVLHPRPK
jgi:hypothetical protein